MTNKMQAIVQDVSGPPDVLELREVDIPEIDDDEVLVRVHAARVDRGVWHMITGLPYFLRLVIPGLGRTAPKNPVPGSDVAGIVSDITDLIEVGEVTPTVDRSFPLSETPKAISYLVDGYARGKVAITSPMWARKGE